MQVRGFFIVLGILLVVSGFCSTAAAQSELTGERGFNPETFQLPVLQFDGTQEKIIIETVMSLLLPAPESPVVQTVSSAGASERATPVSIPSGSIIHHSEHGTTTENSIIPA